MSFTSLTFFSFLTIVLILYWGAKNKNGQNGILLISSYIFISWLNWWFALLIISLTLTDYWVIFKLSKFQEERIRKQWLRVGIFLNIGSLFIFKYFNFFVDSIRYLFDILGFQEGVRFHV